MEDKIKELEERINELEKELEKYKERERELENAIEEYNNLVRKQFEYFEDFLSAFGSNEIVDPLTRVFKKDFILKLLTFYHQRYFESSKEFALLLVDIDNFEEINSKYGRNIGDRVLMNLAKMLKKGVRVPLDSIARLGADEFLVVLSEVNKKQSMKVAERIHRECGKLSINDHTVTVTMSVVHFPTDRNDLSDLLELGEELINRSKAETSGGLKYIG